MSNNLEDDIKNDCIIMNKLYSYYYAQKLYAALCNVDWQKIDTWEILKNSIFSVSWRGAGAMVARLRNTLPNENKTYNILINNLEYQEQYTDFYCSGLFHENQPSSIYVQEGNVDKEIKDDLMLINWKVYKRYGIDGEEIID